MRYIIVGNSVAAVNAIEAIRKIDPEGEITVISDEELFNYSRPLLSYYLGGRISAERLPFRDRSFYERHKVNLVLAKRATSIDVEDKVVKLQDGQSLPYDRLLLSVGGRPIIPPMEGYREDLQGVFTFLKWKDAKELIAYIERHRIEEAVVLGGGLIGLKVVEGLLERGLRVTIVELMDRVLANTFDKEASSVIETRLFEHGCKVLKEDTVQEVILKDGRVSAVGLRSGKEVPTELLIIAVGVRPNMELVQDTPIRTDRGILVDKAMRTSVEDVYAAGDCAQGFDFLAKINAVIAIWPVAARQGKVAGINMAGGEAEYRGLFPMNSVQILDVPTISFGMTNPPEGEGYEVLRRMDRERGIYKKVVLKDGRIVGVILLGNIDRAGVYGMLIREGIEVEGFKDRLLEEDFGLLVLPKDFRKHFVTGEGIVV